MAKIQTDAFIYENHVKRKILCRETAKMSVVWKEYIYEIDVNKRTHTIMVASQSLDV